MSKEWIMMTFVNWVVAVFLTSSAFCQTLQFSPEEQKYLNVFFQMLICHSEVGYVLFGQKPVCWDEFYIDILLPPDTSNRRFLTALHEGLNIWEKHSPPHPNIIIVSHNHDRINKPNVHMFLVINRDLFFKTVNEHLTLFQSVLGPEITAIKLFETLASGKLSFPEALKNNNILIGILLGYGTQNALFTSRMEEILEFLYMPDLPPFQKKFNLIPSQKDSLKEMLISSKTDITRLKPLSPNIGFSSLAEEYEALVQKIEVVDGSLTTEEPLLIFGCLKNDRETERLTSAFEETQKRIKNLMLSKTFLRDVLKMVTNEDVVIDASLKVTLSLPKKNLEYLLAQSIWGATSWV